jgi:Asp-tRNA(Asn)/Glu-tRNA(Gln) amidotransferase A subunit family amidase
MGLGVDIFGDMRYPAACCGVSAFKPTSSRISSVDISGCSDQTLWPAVITPTARHVRDLTFFFKNLWNSELLSKYDPYVSP